MRFTNIRDLKYSIEDKSRIDLFATCKEYGEIPMTLILTDTEDLHTFFDGKTEYPLEEYCKTQKIQEYIEPEIIITVPNSITPLQAKLQLLEIGLLDEVETMVKADRKVELYWNEADNFYRTDSILLGMATALNLNDQQLDDLFIEASKLCQII